VSPTQSVSIRAATSEDIEFLVDGNAQLALESEHLSLDRNRLRDGIRAMFAQPSRGFYSVAEVGGVRAGQMMITFEWSDWRNGVFWWIQSVYTVPEFRRRGVFRALYQYVEELAKLEGNVCGLRLYVEDSNHRAQETYGRCGMKETGYRVLEVDYVLERSYSNQK
jgi:GNAT superfamily N-acetyltransferase